MNAEPSRLPHPEDFCERCGRPNLPAWWVASDLWNATLRTSKGDVWGVLCPQCFADLAESKGVVTKPVWELRLDVNDGKQQTTPAPEITHEFCIHGVRESEECVDCGFAWEPAR